MHVPPVRVACELLVYIPQPDLQRDYGGLARVKLLLQVGCVEDMRKSSLIVRYLRMPEVALQLVKDRCHRLHFAVEYVKLA